MRPHGATNRVLKARRAGLIAAGIAAALILAAASTAGAQTAYVANDGSNDVLAIDTSSNMIFGRPIPAHEAPSGIAITPDARFAYVSNELSDDVTVIDIAAGRPIDTIKVGFNPFGIAISPDGLRAYVANEAADSVSAIDITTNLVLGDPIPVGRQPEATAITPDGRRVYVADRGSESVTVIDAGTNQVLGDPIDVGSEPSGIALTPDGSRAYVTLGGSERVAVIDTTTNQVLGGPIRVGVAPLGIAMTPDGRRAYVTNQGDESVSVIDTTTNQVVGDPIDVGRFPNAIAITADGGRAYVPNEGTDDVSVLDTTSNRPVGPPIMAGKEPFAVAALPDQPPTARFGVSRARPGVQAQLDASASSDPDGAVGSYRWSFGDGAATQTSSAATAHTYRSPGAYRVTLRVADENSCSTAAVFTGQTALCNGQPRAETTEVIHVAFPGVRLRCPTGRFHHRCRYTVQAVVRRDRRRSRVTPESDVARAAVRRGRSAIVSLIPRPNFRRRLAMAKTVLTRVTRRIGKRHETRYRSLAIVR